MQMHPLWRSLIRKWRFRRADIRLAQPKAHI